MRSRDICGTGAVLIPLARKGVNVDGFDISSQNIRRCQDYIIQNNLFTKVFSSLPHDNYDVILVNNVIEYAVDKAAIINNVTSLLNDNGLLLISIANNRHPLIRYESLRALFSGRSKVDIHKSEPNLVQKISCLTMRMLFM